MALSNDNSVTSITGAIQKWLNASFMNLKREMYETPLANPTDAIAGTVPKNQGQAAQFRFFSEFTPDTETGNDSPKLYDPGVDVTDGKTHTATTVIVPLAHIKDAIKLENWAVQTDYTQLLPETRKMLMVLIRRYIHRTVNDSMVRQITSPVAGGSVNYAFGSLPPAFKTIYAGNVPSFTGLTSNSFLTFNDIRRGRAILEQSQAPTFPDGTYHMSMGTAFKNQLMEDDKNFRDVVKRHEGMAKDAIAMAKLPSFEGVTFMVGQDDYRCNLPSAGGALTTRDNSGGVFLGHMYGQAAYGYLTLGNNRGALTPQFKTQDISITGTHTTIGFNIPFRAPVIRQNFGLNIAGASKFTESVTDLPG